ncbi:ParB N-terminal domain-containing protein [Celeribacter halophilus]|uniref:ParB N-terminal domain-containing protein n=1 Tax=Celeribacter halophilus TaxID=576117 RepID=A0AAW7XZZ4_9RHOB|nr:ParB N-terminal domain-containing protein [Celeribacter halophilus]
MTDAQKETNPADPVSKAPETKSTFPLGVAQTSSRPAPIAQVAGDAAVTAALAEMTDMVTQARAEGRIVERLPLSAIDLGHLVRDRLKAQSEDLEALKSSLKARGQQVPVEVLDRGAKASPRYGLISGWRRMLALSEIGVDEVLAVVREPKSASDAYVAMVEENEIRSDISFYERARIVVKALEQGVYSDPKSALQSLFANVSRAKRSKIKSFMVLVEALDDVLRFPTSISEKNGLVIAKALQVDPSVANNIREGLSQTKPENAEQEIAALLKACRPAEPKKPVQNKAPRQISLHFDTDAKRIELSGEGIDEAFMSALESWLKKQ